MKKQSKSWYKPKGYTHFSPKFDNSQKTFVENYITKDLETHNFFPLIHETLSARRYKAYLNENNDLYRSHFDTVKNKPSKKPREIFYANHLDAQIYSYFSNEVLGKKYEELLSTDSALSDTIIAYRKIPIDKSDKKGKCKCNIHFANELFLEIDKRKNCVVACYDIENFFPSLNHTYLKQCWVDLIGPENFTKSHEKVFNSLVKYSYVEMKDIVEQCTNHDLGIIHKNDFKKSDFTSYFINAREFREKIAKKNLIWRHKPAKKGETLKGIPQGTPISAFLANLYLLEFDKFVVEELVKKANCFYRRYSDDIAIIFNSVEDFIAWDEKIVNKISSTPIELKINQQKTVVSEFLLTNGLLTCNTKTELNSDYSPNHALKYLGFEYDGRNVLLKPASLSKFYREMKMAIRRKANRANSALRYNRRYPRRKKKETKIHLTKLYSRFSHLGKNKSKSNYLSYVDRASQVIYPGMSGKGNPIKKQVIRAWSIFRKSINKYEAIVMKPNA
ncbi:MAG: reverse transcriptase domain-containing protein [Bacteroidota bacterium]